jgi:hypothetical protein
MPCTQPILFSLIILYVATSTNYETPHYASFFVVLSLLPSWFQILPSAPCPQRPSVFFLKRDRPSFTPIKTNRQNYCFVYIYVLKQKTREDQLASWWSLVGVLLTVTAARTSNQTKTWPIQNPPSLHILFVCLYWYIYTVTCRSAACVNR